MILNRSKLLKAATKFRDAIEKCHKGLKLLRFENFPRGSCGDTVYLLGRYLKDQGIGSFDCYCGSIMLGQYDEQSHAWLQNGNLYLDITADQFDEINDRVIIVENSFWHQKFQSKYEHEADFNVFKHDELTFKRFESTYNTILRSIG
ncbi:MAG: hypothetical protein CVV64_11465 [Candidatus Wallbacteria bacterium HGW-Wallbacteria-1]|jgi:hypothetical protein|uniref:Microcin J25-processing protein McjB C-terminal domain-containing protein n=1 Tax=Candidatus Wallbacteria bacterium HGW-Wallbacteria-1 TaxID=2013854 RepID=A0A2N1PNL7_9BACT|nr:MAG: hypothetical protein CVV64_11465 [Candidatus Wallbacteria bacterium HGW-Wallbacteria-1]